MKINKHNWYLVLILLLTSKKSAAIGSSVNAIAIILASVQAYNGQITSGQYSVIVTSALSITVVMLGFFLVMFITGTKANIRDLYDKTNTNTTNIAANKERMDTRHESVKQEMGDVKKGIEKIYDIIRE